MVAFYNQGDQDIYQSGQFYIPQEQYRLDYKAPLPTSETETVTQGFGIPYTNALTGGGGGGGSPMSVGQNISDFQSAINKRQENLQNPSKIANFIGDYIPQQRSVVDMMRSGVKDVRATKGLPFGIGALIARGLPDKYYQMPVGDQTFIQSQMGYTDPGSNIGNKDPFGINVRSMFGNYADYVTEEADKLEKIVADQKKRGLTDTLQMKKLRYYKPLRMKRQNIQSDVGLIEKGKAAAAEQHQAQQQQMEQDRQGGQNPSAQSFRSAPGGLSQKQSREARGDPKGTGGGWKWAEGGRIGYRNGEFVDENINVEGPNFDVNENVEMAEGPSPFEMRIDELMDEGLSWEEAYNIASQEFSSAEGPEESLSQEGIASIV